MNGDFQGAALDHTTAPLFVGRTQELREITSFLAANQSVSLVGLPGMGKSALLRHLARPTTPADPRLDTALLYAYLDCGTLQESAAAGVFGQIAATLAAALAARALPREPAVAAAVAQPSRLTFEAALRRLNGRGLQVVLALDAFEALSGNTALGVPFFNALRAAAGRFKLSFLTASDRTLYALTEHGWSHELLSSPFFNIFAAVVLGPLGEAEARHLIRLLLRAHEVRDSAMLEDDLYALVGGYPPALAIACRLVATQAGDNRGPAARAQAALHPCYAALWQRLSPPEQAWLHQCSAGHAAAPTSQDGRALVQGLARKGLLVAAGSGSYRPASQAWARFITMRASA
jgi:hypothetical protein